MEKGSAYGYELLEEINEHSLTAATVERGARYRTLRTLKVNGNVVSGWDVRSSGPARRQYKLTKDGEIHLEEWAEEMGTMVAAMGQFVDGVDELIAKEI